MPQTLRTMIVTVGNQIVAKLSMYCTNYHRINHDVEMCRNKKKEVIIVTLLKPLCRLVNLQDH